MTVETHRAMDGAVLPIAQRQGLFTRTIRAEMECMAEGRRPAHLTYSTSVPASREAYRKLGWTIATIPHVATLAYPSMRKAADVVWDDALDHEYPRVSHTELRTDWSASALRWRLSPQSGLKYRTVRLRRGDTPHGAVVCVTELRRCRTLAVVHTWGDERTVTTLVRAAATRTACPLLLSVETAPGLWHRAVGSSTVSLWSPSEETTASVREALRFDLADLEGVM